MPHRAPAVAGVPLAPFFGEAAGAGAAMRRADWLVPRAFSAAADMKSESGKSGLDYWVAEPAGGFGGIVLRGTLDVPVIACVNGHALDGGMEMVLGCDIVVAVRHATFGLP